MLEIFIIIDKFIILKIIGYIINIRYTCILKYLKFWQFRKYNCIYKPRRYHCFRIVIFVFFNGRLQRLNNCKYYNLNVVLINPINQFTYLSSRYYYFRNAIASEVNRKIWNYLIYKIVIRMQSYKIM